MYPTTRHEETCIECGGEGSIEVQDPGPYSPTAIEPRWSQCICPTCHGFGVVDVDRCGRCGLATDLGDLGETIGRQDWDYCQCDEDVLMLWERGFQNPEVGEAASHVVYTVDRDMYRQAGTVHELRRIARYLRHEAGTDGGSGNPVNVLVTLLSEEADARDYVIHEDRAEDHL